MGNKEKEGTCESSGNNSENGESYLTLSRRKLTNLFKHKGNDIKNLRSQLRNRDKQYLSGIDSIFEQVAESEKYSSSIYIDKNGRIVGSTPTFRKNFSFDNPDRPIKGRHIFTALKIPEDAPDYIRNIKERFKEPEKLKLQTTIFNGKGEEKIIRFKKYHPIVLKIGDENHSYARVDIYEIGWVEREMGRAKRMLHMVNGEPSTLEEFITKKLVEKTKEDAERQKSEILSQKTRAYRGAEENKPRFGWLKKKKKQRKNQLNKNLLDS